MMLVINLNSNTCRIYEYKRHSTDLSLKKEILHPENRLKTSEQVDDGLGRYKTNNASQNAYAPHMDIKDVHIDKFAREIASELNIIRNKNNLEKFLIISPPHMLGLLNQHLDKHVKEKIFKTIQKDLIELPENELAKYLKEHAQFEGD